MAAALIGWRKVGIAFGFGLLIVFPFLLEKPISDAACYALAGVAAAAITGNAVSKFAKVVTSASRW